MFWYGTVMVVVWYGMVVMGRVVWDELVTTSRVDNRTDTATTTKDKTTKDKSAGGYQGVRARRIRTNSSYQVIVGIYLC